MKKEFIKEKIISILKKSGFDLFLCKGSFDIAAKRKEMFFIKILSNVDAFKIYQANDLKIISNGFNSFPFLIGEKTSHENLEENIVYERFGLPTITPDTLENILFSNYPEIFRFRGGFFVDIDKEKLRKARQENNLTQEMLAKETGITKKCVYEHEKIDLKLSYETAKKIEKSLKSDIIKKIELETFPKKYYLDEKKEKEPLVNEFKRIGFETQKVENSPFKIFAEKKERVLTNNYDKNINVEIFKQFSDFVESIPLVVSEKKLNLKIPTINKNELKKFKDAESFIEFLRCG